MSLTNEQVEIRARDWAELHSKPKTRDQMDVVLEGLSSEDQRRVYLCGQRIAAGLPAKVIPATNQKEASNEKTKRRTSPAKQGAGGNKDKVSVGTDSESAKSNSPRKRSVRPKQ